MKLKAETFSLAPGINEYISQLDGYDKLIFAGALPNEAQFSEALKDRELSESKLLPYKNYSDFVTGWENAQKLNIATKIDNIIHEDFTGVTFGDYFKLEELTPRIRFITKK